MARELERVQRLVAQLYEDRTAGRIGETNFYPLLERYESKTAALEQQIDTLQPDSGAENLQRLQERLWAIIRRYTDVEELTPSLLFELIDRIEVGQGYIRKNRARQGQAAEDRYSFSFSAQTL